MLNNVLVSSEILRHHASVLDAGALIHHLSVHYHTVVGIDLIQLGVVLALRVVPQLALQRQGRLLVRVGGRQSVLR